MKHALITTAAAALLLASQGAFAQPGNRGDGPGAGQGPGMSPGQGPGNSGPGAGPSVGPGPGRGPDAGPPGRSQGPAPGMQQRGPGADGPGPRAEQPQQRPTQKQAEPKAQQQPQQRTGEGRQQPTPRADVKGKDADTNRTARDNNLPKADGKDIQRKEADRTGKDADRKRQNDTAQGKDRDRGPDTAQDKDRDRNRDTARTRDNAQDKGQDRGHSDRMAGSQDLRQARERLEANERTRLHSAFDKRSARTNIRVNVNIGSRVPRDIRLVRVPQTVITFFPYYRDYSYFVEEETVYIVNPRTYEVVDVIDESYARGQPVQQARLTLSDRQITLVQEVIADADIRPENLRLRLALGAEIPRDIELYRFPDRVLDNVRVLERYRFVVVEDQIVIVNPDDRSIALVIDRT